MKKLRIKSLSITLIFSVCISMLAGYSASFTFAEETSVIQREQISEGDLSLSELENRVLPAEDKPEAISGALIAEKGYVNRLREQESDLNSLIFQNQDGNKTLYCFANPVKYVDENGEVRDKSNRLTDNENDGYINRDNDVRTLFPKILDADTGLVLTYQDIKIELVPVSKIAAEAQKQTVENRASESADVINYNGVFGGHFSEVCSYL